MVVRTSSDLGSADISDSAPGVVVHRIRDDNSAATLVELLGDYDGTIVCDALKTHAAGWTCIASSTRPSPINPEPEKALTWICALYDIDERAEGDRNRIADLRRAESVRVLAQLKDWLWSQRRSSPFRPARQRATRSRTGIGSRVSYRGAHSSREQRHRARDPRSGCRTQESLRVEVAPRHRGRG